MAPSTIKALKSALETGKFAPVWLFHGEDDYLKDGKVREVIARVTEPATRDFNLDVRRGSELDPAALSDALEALPMMAERRLVVIRDVLALKKEARARLDRHLRAPSTDTVLLLVVPAGAKPDAALIAGAESVEFKPLSDDALQKWIQHEVKGLKATISPAAISLLASLGGHDLAQLAGELHKLANYTNGAPIDEAAVAAVTGIRPGVTMADLLDLVAKREMLRAVAMVEELLMQPKTSGVQLVMALTSQFLAIGWGLAAKADGLEASRLDAEYWTLLKSSGGAYTGRPWGDAVKCWVRALPHWDLPSVERAIRELVRADAALKDTRVSSETQILTSLLLSMSRSSGERRAA